jgi:4a-hydroxytetrahydrobiopterin dehydratase
MDELNREKFTACRRDSPRVSDAELVELRPQIPEWKLIEGEGIARLERVFRFGTSPTPWHFPIASPRWRKEKAITPRF